MRLLPVQGCMAGFASHRVHLMLGEQWGSRAGAYGGCHEGGIGARELHIWESVKVCNYELLVGQGIGQRLQQLHGCRGQVHLSTFICNTQKNT